ncbi:MAG: shikimate kinase I [Candidatus Marinimicrobia bacterium]|nr:shikimate kinase I [Candidatus Neomarinimicrobiota bacterium]|tara:strand:+ start:1720 stop:2235 length:516 start_codon:yes stop_codon:yes gene_type:complete
MNSNIYLIGMMASGKSTIGKMLADLLKLEFIDTDKKIENFMRLPISKIFEEFGEDRFRAMEESYFTEKSQLSNLIISTGGGIILSHKNRKILQSASKSIYLKASPKILSKRVEKKIYKRPLLLNQNHSILSTLNTLFEKRNNLYENSAQFTIKTDSLSKTETFNEVLSCIV